MRTTLLLLLLLTARIDAWAEVSFTAQGAGQARVGDYYEVAFTLVADKRVKGEPVFPDFDGFEVISGPNQSTSTSIVNLDVSHSLSWSFRLSPRREGNLTIGAAAMQVGGQVYRTRPLAVKVGGGEAASGDEPPELFMRAVVSSTSPYQGEQIIYQLKVYFRVNVQNYQPEDFQRSAGFIVEEFPLPRRPEIRQELVDGVQYNVAVIRKLALFPTVTGPLEIPSSATSFDIVKQRRSRRSGDIFDQFFSGGMLENYTEQRRLRSKTIVLQVKPLPDPAPADFNGMVGSFSLQTEIDRTALQTNEPLTFTATVKGRGNIKLIPEFSLQLPHDIEAYPPEVESNISRRNMISGFKRFKYLLVPRHPGQQLLKPLRFSYFDPEAETYVTLESKDIALQVERSADYFPGGSILRSGEPIQTYGVDIEYIRTATPRFLPAGKRFVGSWLFLLVTLIPLLLPLTAWGWRLYHDSLQRNIDMRRFRQARPLARRALKRAQHALRKAQPAESIALISQALVGYLADKFGVPAAGLVWNAELAKLRERDIAEELIEELAEIGRYCDFARFAAPTETPGGRDTTPGLPPLEQLLQRSEGIINRLERVL